MNIHFLTLLGLELWETRKKVENKWIMYVKLVRTVKQSNVFFFFCTEVKTWNYLGENNSFHITFTYHNNNTYTRSTKPNKKHNSHLIIYQACLFGLSHLIKIFNIAFNSTFVIYKSDFWCLSWSEGHNTVFGLPITLTG